MDIRMSVMDGYEAAKRIRSLPKGSETKIIVLSASAFEEERDVAFAKGCDDFLLKPFREYEIFALLHKHLGIRFVYEEEAVRDAISEIQGRTLSSAALAALPSDLLINLEQAALTNDITKISALTNEVRLHNPVLADALAHLANNYEYMVILAALRQLPSPQRRVLYSLMNDI